MLENHESLIRRFSSYPISGVIIHEKGVPLQDPRCDRKRRPRSIVFFDVITAINKDILLSAASPAAATPSKVVMATSSKVVTVTAASAGDKA